MSTPDTRQKAELDILTLTELVQDVANATRVSRQAAEAGVNAVLETIVQSLKAGLRVEIRGFGIFGVRDRGLLVGRNSGDGAKATVAARRVPYFKPGRELTNRVDSQVPGNWR